MMNKLKLESFGFSKPKTGWTLSEGENNSDLGASAAKMALDKAGCTSKDLDLIVYATFTPDYLMPSTSCVISEILEAGTTAAIDINSGGIGIIQGMDVAAGFLNAGDLSRILLVGSDALSRLIDEDSAENTNTFADCAGAFILTKGEDPMIIRSGVIADSVEKFWVPAGGTAAPVTGAEIKAGKHKIQFDLEGFLESSIPKIVEEFKKLSNSFEYDWVIVPGIVHNSPAFIEALGIPNEKILNDFDLNFRLLTGNIPYVLGNSEKISKGDRVIAMALGSGITWALAGIQI